MRLIIILLLLLGKHTYVTSQVSFDTVLLEKIPIGNFSPLSGALAFEADISLQTDVNLSSGSAKTIVFSLSQGIHKHQLWLHALLVESPTGSVSISFDTDFDGSVINEERYIIVNDSGRQIIECESGILLELKYPKQFDDHLIKAIKWRPFICTTLKLNHPDTLYAKYGGAIYAEEILKGHVAITGENYEVIVQNKTFDLAISQWKEQKYFMRPLSDANLADIKAKDYKALHIPTLIHSSVYNPEAFLLEPFRLVAQRNIANKPLGIAVGFYVDSENVYCGLNGNSIRLVSEGPLFTLIEFWGTWCGPCMALYPKFSSMLARHTTSLRYVGVALDKNPELVSEYIKAKPLISQQHFVKINESKGSIVDQFAVENFPTFILVDQTGRIVFRETGTVGFEKLEQFLNETAR